MNTHSALFFLTDPNVNADEVEVPLEANPNTGAAGVLFVGFVFPNDMDGVEEALVEVLVLPNEKEGGADVFELGVADAKERDGLLFPVAVAPNEREGVLEFDVPEASVAPKERTGVAEVVPAEFPNENEGTDVFEFCKVDSNESDGLLVTEVLGAPKVRIGEEEVEVAFTELFIDPKLNAGTCDSEAVFALGAVIELLEEFVAPNENTGFGAVSVLFPEVVLELPNVNDGDVEAVPLDVSLEV
jgi:hypothetical protein